MHTFPSATTSVFTMAFRAKYTRAPASISGFAAEREFHAWYQCLHFTGISILTSVPAMTACLMALYASSPGTR